MECVNIFSHHTRCGWCLRVCLFDFASDWKINTKNSKIYGNFHLLIGFNLFLCSVVQISLPKRRCCCALINSFMKLNNDCLFNCWSVVYYIYGIVLRSNGLLLLLMLLLKHSLTFNCMRVWVCLLCSFFGFVYFNASLERLLTTICITILLFFIHWNYFIIILFILLFLCCDGNETRSTFSTVACCVVLLLNIDKNLLWRRKELWTVWTERVCMNVRLYLLLCKVFVFCLHKWAR